MLHGQLPLRLMISAIAVRTSSRTIATVHRFTPPIKYVYILIFWKLQVKIFRYFPLNRKTLETFRSPGYLTFGHNGVIRHRYIILSVNQWLLDNGSNTTWSYSSTTLTLFEYRISSYFLCFLVANFAENCCFCILYFNLFDFLAPFWHRIEIIYLS